MEETPQSPYENPAIQAASQGDRLLLDRLVARVLASEMLHKNPDDPEAQKHFQIMDDEVKARQQELGILPDDPSSTPS